MSYTIAVMAFFVIFLPILTKTWMPWKRPLDSCNQKMSSLDWSTTKTHVISIHIFAISCRNAFIATLVPKLVALVTPLCNLCTGVSQTNSLMVQPYLKTKLCMDKLHTTEVMAIFVIFVPILAKIWLSWQRPLERCCQICLFCIVQPWKPPVVSNHILVISHTNSFICIYSNISPKIGCHSNALLSFVYRSLTDEFLDSANANPVSKPNSARMCCIQLKLWPFLWYFCLFWPQIGCHGDVP